MWRVLEHGHSGYPDSVTTILTDNIITLKCFDAIEASNSDGNRRSYGNNDWAVSNLRQWLNSAEAAGQWYSAQHAADAPPTAANCWSGNNPYDAAAGFLAGFTAQERALLVSTPLDYAGWSANAKTSTDKMFLLSSNEVGLETLAGNGTKFACFTDNNSRLAKPTASAVSNSTYSNASFNVNAAWYWWLRTSYTSISYNARYVHNNGTLNSNGACFGYNGVRPACNLPSNISLSDTTDADGCYTIIYNTPPTAPATITVPSEIRSTVSYDVTWATSTDVDGNLTGYILEKNIDEAGWVQAYQGSARSYTDTMPLNTQTVQYRVKAYDAAGDTSAYTTSAVRTVVNNRPPEIAGADGPLGSFGKNPPTYSYTITDADNDDVTVKTYIDNQQLSTGAATLGTEAEITLTAAQWTKTLNGDHTFKVVATDENEDSTTKTVAFTKAVHTAEFVLATPMAADDKPTTAILNIQGSFPTGSTLSVQICNNANDEEPTWEDATSAALYGTKHFFTNSTKTATNWGVGLKVSLARGSATGDVYVQSLGGNFA